MGDNNLSLLREFIEDFPQVSAKYGIADALNENERLRAALWKIAFDWHYDNPETALNVLTNIARAALAGGKKDD